MANDVAYSSRAWCDSRTMVFRFVRFGSISTFLQLASRVRSAPAFRHTAALRQLKRWASFRLCIAADGALIRSLVGEGSLAGSSTQSAFAVLRLITTLTRRRALPERTFVNQRGMTDKGQKQLLAL